MVSFAPFSYTSISARGVVMDGAACPWNRSRALLSTASARSCLRCMCLRLSGGSGDSSRRSRVISRLRVGAPELAPVDLAPVVLRQRRRELHRAGVLEGRETGLHEVLQLPSQRLIAAPAGHYVGLGLDQPVRAFIPDHGAFRHTRMLEKAILHLVGAHEDAADLQHVVGAALVPEAP